MGLADCLQMKQHDRTPTGRWQRNTCSTECLTSQHRSTRSPGRCYGLSLAGPGPNDLNPVRGGRVEPVEADSSAGESPFQPHQSKERLIAMISYYAVGDESPIALVGSNRGA